MNRFFAVLGVVTLIVATAGCGGETATPPENEAPTDTTNQEVEPTASREEVRAEQAPDASPESDTDTTNQEVEPTASREVVRTEQAPDASPEADEVVRRYLAAVTQGRAEAKARSAARGLAFDRSFARPAAEKLLLKEIRRLDVDSRLAVLRLVLDAADESKLGDRVEDVVHAAVGLQEHLRTRAINEVLEPRLARGELADGDVDAAIRCTVFLRVSHELPGSPTRVFDLLAARQVPESPWQARLAADDLKFYWRKIGAAEAFRRFQPALDAFDSDEVHVMGHGLFDDVFIYTVYQAPLEDLASSLKTVTRWYTLPPVSWPPREDEGDRARREFCGRLIEAARAYPDEAVAELRRTDDPVIFLRIAMDMPEMLTALPEQGRRQLAEHERKLAFAEARDRERPRHRPPRLYLAEYLGTDAQRSYVDSLIAAAENCRDRDNFMPIFASMGPVSSLLSEEECTDLLAELQACLDALPTSARPRWGARDGQWRYWELAYTSFGEMVPPTHGVPVSIQLAELAMKDPGSAWLYRVALTELGKKLPPESAQEVIKTISAKRESLPSDRDYESVIAALTPKPAKRYGVRHIDGRIVVVTPDSPDDTDAAGADAEDVARETVNQLGEARSLAEAAKVLKSFNRLPLDQVSHEIRCQIVLAALSVLEESAKQVEHPTGTTPRTASSREQNKVNEQNNLCGNLETAVSTLPQDLANRVGNGLAQVIWDLNSPGEDSTNPKSEEGSLTRDNLSRSLFILLGATRAELTPEMTGAAVVGISNAYIGARAADRDALDGPLRKWWGTAERKVGVRLVTRLLSEQDKAGRRLDAVDQFIGTVADKIHPEELYAAFELCRRHHFDRIHDRAYLYGGYFGNCLVSLASQLSSKDAEEAIRLILDEWPVEQLNAIAEEGGRREPPDRVRQDRILREKVLFVLMSRLDESLRRSLAPQITETKIEMKEDEVFDARLAACGQSLDAYALLFEQCEWHQSAKVLESVMSNLADAPLDDKIAALVHADKHGLCNGFRLLQMSNWLCAGGPQLSADHLRTRIEDPGCAGNERRLLMFMLSGKTDGPKTWNIWQLPHTFQ